MSACYVWKNDEVLVIHGDITCTRALQHKILECFVVDATCIPHQDRYGKFKLTKPMDCYWKEEPIENFPSEFRTHLLLLGIS